MSISDGPFDARAFACLRAAVDRLVPADEWPGGWEGGVAAYIVARAGDDLRWAMEPLRRAAAWLDAEAHARHRRDFDALPPAEADVLLAACLDEEDGAALLRVTYEGYYGGGGTADPPSWQMVGFEPVPPGVVPVDPPLPRHVALDALRERYDAVVIGSGAGGGVAACVLAEEGARVLLVERGRPLRNSDLRGNHLHGKRQAIYDPTAGPGAGNPRVALDTDGGERVVDGNDGGRPWGLNAMCVGGGTRVWQGMAWRFMAEDFAMASTYGVPEGSTLADWPISYAELEPYYTRVEHELGVAGSEGALTVRTPRSGPYPMPAMGEDELRRRLGAAADRLGWSWDAVPLAINSRPRGGRAACVRCHQCVGHACPVDAKNGSHNTYVERALATGRCDLLLSTQVVEVLHDAGRASGLRLVVDDADGDREATVRCDAVVVAAGAIETPRLLRASGFGNDQLGRHLHSHGVTMAVGLDDEPLGAYRGPGHSVATLDFVHAGHDGWGGGVLFDLFAQLPLTAAQLATEFDVPAWGPAHKRWTREGVHHVLGVASITQEIPSADAGVVLDRSLRDARGVPAPRIRAAMHPLTHEIERQMVERSLEWLEAAGCRGAFDIGRIWGAGPRPPADEHSAGTARMGDDPATSACDRFGLLHGATNVWVSDASLHPTNGSVNPTLTIFANSLRVAEHIARDIGR